MLQREVARILAHRVTDDTCHFLRDVRRDDPRLDRELARFAEDVEQLAAGDRRGLGLARPLGAIADRDAPAAVPLDVAREVQVNGRVDAARVRRDISDSLLEFPQGDLVVFVAIAARGYRAVEQADLLTGNQGSIDRLGRADAGNESVHPGRYLLARGHAVVVPAVVEFVAHANHETRVIRRIEIDLRLDRFVGDNDVRVRKIRLLRGRRLGAVTARAILQQAIVTPQVLFEQRRVVREVDARRRILVDGSLQHDLAAAFGGEADPVLDPGGHDRATGARRVDPAVVADRRGADLRDKRRIRGLVAVDQERCLFIREVHIVPAHKVRGLAAIRRMAGTAAVRPSRILPELQPEALYVGIGRRRTRIRGFRPGDSAGIAVAGTGNVLGRLGATAASGDKEAGQQGCKYSFHGRLPTGPCSIRRYPRIPSSS